MSSSTSLGARILLQLLLAGVLFWPLSSQAQDYSNFGARGLAVLMDHAQGGGFEDIHIQPDGKIVALGEYLVGNKHQILLVRFKTDGTLDSSFGKYGRLERNSTSDEVGVAFAMGHDGSFAVLASSDTNVLILRLYANGQPQLNFGYQGARIQDFSGKNRPHAIGIDDEGGILISGATMGYGTEPGVPEPFEVSYPFVARYTAQGDLDSTYGVNTAGRYILDYGLQGAAFNAMHVYPDGSVFLAGYAENLLMLFVARLGLQTFGSGLPVQAGASTLVPAPSGFILGGGAVSPMLIGVHSNTSLDTTFGVNGVVIPTAGYKTEHVQDIARDSLGRYVFSVLASSTGTIAHGERYSLVCGRVLADGQLDSSFGPSIPGYPGLRLLHVHDSIDYGNSVAVAPEGSVFIAGSTVIDTIYYPFVMRVEVGKPENISLGGDKPDAILPHPMGIVQAMGSMQDGSLMIGGTTQQDISVPFLERRTMDLSLDPSYGTNGVSLLQQFNRIGIACLTAGSNGQTYTILKSGSLFFATRTDERGTADTSYTLLSSISGKNMGAVVGEAVDTSNKLVVCGRQSFPAVGVITRMREDGSPDSSFGTVGRLTLIQPLQVSAMMPAADGGYIAAGYWDSGPDRPLAVIHVGHEGEIDTSVGVLGVQLLPPLVTWDHAQAIARDSSGGFILAGNSFYGPDLEYGTHFLLARLHPDGSFDTTFGERGHVLPKTEFPYNTRDTTTAVAVTKDGKIVLVGTSTYHGRRAIVVFRYAPDGTPDLHFGHEGYLAFELDSDYATSDAMVVRNNGEILIAARDGMHARESKLLRIYPTLSVPVSASPSADEMSVFPDPIHDDATLLYSLSEAGLVTLELCDETGSHVRTILKDASRGVGEHRITLDFHSLPSGRYFVILRRGTSHQILNVIHR